MAMNSYEKKLLNEAFELIEAFRDVHGDDITNYVESEIEMLLTVNELDVDACAKLSDCIKDIGKIIGPYIGGNIPNNLLALVQSMSDTVTRNYGFEIFIADDWTIRIESNKYFSIVTLQTVNIAYSTAYGTAPAAKAKTSYLYSTYALTADELPTLTADNVTFKGWTLDGVAVSEGTSVSGDVTLVAEWEEVPPSTGEELSFIKFLCSPVFPYLPKNFWGWKMAQK